MFPITITLTSEDRFLDKYMFIFDFLQMFWKTFLFKLYCIDHRD